MPNRILVSRGTPPIKLVPGKSTKVTAMKDQAYQVVDLSAPPGNAPADPAKLSKEGADLVVNYPDGTALTMTDFFVVCPGGACTLTLADGTATGQVVNAGAIAAGGEGLGFWGWTGIIGGIGALAAAGGGGGGGGAAPNPAPTLSGSTPSHNQFDVVVGSNVQLTFNETVQAGTGNIVISNGSDTRNIPVTDASQVQISGSTVTINPTLDLQPASHYTVTIGAGVLKDAGGADFAGIVAGDLAFNTYDPTAPTLLTRTPADNATAVLVGSNIVLDFNKGVQAGTGNIVISDGAGDTRTISVTDASQVTISGNRVTINPTTNLLGNSHYSVTMAAGVIVDTQGQAFAGITGTTAFDFDTQDLAAPTLSTTGPLDNATGVLIGRNLVFTFSESIVQGTGNIVVTNLDDGNDSRTVDVSDTSQVTISTNRMTVNLASDLRSNAHYAVTIAAGAVKDAAGNGFGGLSGTTAFDFYTQDLQGPVLVGSTPSDNATGFASTGSIVLTFDEAVRAGSGDFRLANGAGDIQTISVTDTAHVAIVGSTVTITPLRPMQGNTNYNLQMAAGVLQDAAGNAYAGIASSTELNFGVVDTGAPTLVSSSPADGAPVVQVTDSIVLTFSEAVKAGTGSITISDGAGDTRTIQVSNAQVVFNGTAQVTITPTTPFKANSHYTVTISSGAITDLVGNPFAGIAAGAAIDFDTTGINLSAVAAGSGGFSIDGWQASEQSGSSVSAAGDVNGDGLDDVIVGAPYSSNGGRSYVVFGQTGTASVQASAMGTRGFVINAQCALDNSGCEVSAAGDFNGDGLGDLLVGAHYSDPVAGDKAGRAYIVFGQAASLDVALSDIGGAGFGSTRGFVINGQAVGDNAGVSVSGLGDVNGDGLSDVLIGAYIADTAGGADAGKAYVVFGRTGSGAIDLSAVAAGNGGFVVNGQAAADNAGRRVSDAGDVNGDGYADLLVGAYLADSPSATDAGRAYVVYGKSSGAAVNLSAVAAGTGGFVINGQAISDGLGHGVSAAGDVNGDGLADVVVGAWRSDTTGGTDAGRSYVVFGRTGTTAVNVSALAGGTGGFVINGEAAQDASGWNVSAAGDVNGDGLTDLLISAEKHNVAVDSAGRAYLVFGKTSGSAIDLSAVARGVGGFAINGQAASDAAGHGVSAAGDVNGDGLADLIVGANLADTSSGSEAGRSYVIFGSTVGAFGASFVDQYGTAGADVVSDGGVTQTLVTGAGDDTLTATSTSVLYGGAGNDRFEIGSAMISALQNPLGAGGDNGRLVRVDGGSGVDTLTLSGAGLTLDLTQVANQSGGAPDGGSRIDGIERIDLTGSGSNTLVLSAADVRDLTAANQFNEGNGWTGLGAVVPHRQLQVTGDAGDSLNLTGTWLRTGLVSNGGKDYAVYRDSADTVQLLVGTGITVSGSITVDAGPFLVSTSQADGSLAAPPGNLVLTFSETVSAVGGYIRIDGGADQRLISVTDGSKVSISGSTVTVQAGLLSNNHYSVSIDRGAFRDSGGTLFVGTVLDFDTTSIVLDSHAAGSGGFVINGQCLDDQAGYSVSSAGDINGDGLADMIVSSPNGDVTAGANAGKTYVVFGRTDTTDLALSAVEQGNGGFVINGQAASAYTGRSVSGAGDVNGDGLDDVLVEYSANFFLTGTLVSRTYVVFGKTGQLPVELSGLDAGSGSGFVIAGDYSAHKVSSAGDVNGDGFDDVLIGANNGGPVYVVFGGTAHTPVDLASVENGERGFAIKGEVVDGNLGLSVSGAGDVNGDGLADLVVADTASSVNGTNSGRAYVVFGRTATTAVELSSVSAGTGGFAINGQAASQWAGRTVTGVGDVNGDGLSDVLVTASGVFFDIFSGSSYVVFGRTSTSPINLSAVQAGSGGFVVSGIPNGSNASDAGDVNGDGLADMLVSTPATNFLVFGRHATTPVNLSEVAAGSGGFEIKDLDSNSNNAISAAGDVNGDGLADLLFGALTSSPGGVLQAGKAYVVFGSTQGAFAHTFVDQYGTQGADNFSDNGTAATLVTGLGDDVLTATAASVLYGGAGNDVFVVGSGMIDALRNPYGSGGNLDRLARIDGGAGLDTLRVSGSGVVLDLSAIADTAGSDYRLGSRLSGIERIDLTGSGDNSLLLSIRDIHDMVDARDGMPATWPGYGISFNDSHLLVIDGNAGDSVTVGGAWLAGGTTTAEGNTYTYYTEAFGHSRILIDNDITRSVNVPPVLSGSELLNNAVDGDIVLTFSEVVQAGSGTIEISDGLDTRVIAVTDASQVEFSGNELRINPADDLSPSSAYTVRVSEGAVTDLAGSRYWNAEGTELASFVTAGATAAPVAASALTAGQGGFVINGVSASERVGASMSAIGDINGDGLVDFVIGADESDPLAGTNAGRSYVVFGKTGTQATDLTAIAAGAGGFVINGPSEYSYSGRSVSSAGDVNGDGIADLIVGAPWGGASGGRAYVVWGKASTSAVNLASLGTAGFVINGPANDDGTGQGVAGAGDVNGDGLADLIVGAPYSSVGGLDSGKAYVVFGRTATTTVELSSASGWGFSIDGSVPNARLGQTVSSVGDINGDGLADIAVSPFGSGSLYVVMGRSSTTSLALSVGVADGSWLKIVGIASVNASVANAGDVNGDGYADLVIGDQQVGSYVVFGGTSLGSLIDLSRIDAGQGGFVVERPQNAIVGESVSSAGDINGDGLADLIVGGEDFDSNGLAYVVYGRTNTTRVSLDAVEAGVGGFKLEGQEWRDAFGSSVTAAGDVNGDGLADLLIGADRADVPGGTDAGRAFVLFGGTTGTFLHTEVDQFGSAGADVFSDGGVAQTLVTGLGNDTLSAGAASRLYGGSGSDLFVLDNAMIVALQNPFGSGGNVDRLSRVDGGTGIDTISLAGAGLTLDLTQVANQGASNPDGGSRIEGIERIDLTGTGNNTLVLQLRDVLDMGSANTFVANGRQQLLVTGNAGDTLDLADAAGTTGWSQAGTVSINTVTYNVWNHATALATVYVNPALGVI